MGRAYMVRSVRFPSATEARRSAAPGLDLDSLDSGPGSLDDGADCQEFAQDFVSPLDSALSGIDNTGQGFIDTVEGIREGLPTFDEALAEASSDGRIRWVIRLGNLPTDDEAPPWLPIEVLLVDASEEIALDPMGRPAPGQALRATPVASVEAFVRRRVTWGAVAEPLEIPFAGDVYIFPFDRFRLGGVSIRARDDAAVIDANFGGSFAVDALVPHIAEYLDAPGIEPTLEAILESVADLDPTPGEPMFCERVSVGFDIEAVEVMLIE